MVKRKLDQDVESLVFLGRQSYVSKRGIAALVATFKRDGLPVAASRSTQYRYRKSMCKTQTPYGEIVRPVKLACPDGATVDAALQHPLAMLYHVASTSSDFADVLRRSIIAHPCVGGLPWNIIFYQDGIDPSDGLSNNHSRKSNVFYWSFLEFGMAALSNEQNWFPLALGRYNQLMKAECAITQLALKAINQFFDPNGHDIELGGVTLKLHGLGELLTIFAILGVVLADEPAIKEIYACKGHSGTKPCLICFDAVAHLAPGGSDGLHAFDEYPVSIRAVTLSAFKQHSDASLRYAVRRVHNAKATEENGDFELLEQLHGFNYNPYSLIVNEAPRWKPASSLMWDWGHCTICDGIADVEFGMFMKQMHTNKTATTYAELQTYVEGWSLPKSLPKLTQLFDETPARNNLRKENFTSSASEFLTLVPILVRYLSVICLARGDCMPFVLSMLACLEVMELLQAIKRGVVAPEILQAAIEHHLKLFVEAHGGDRVRPKHHYMLHLGKMLRYFRTLLATLVNERKHRRVLQYSRDRHSLVSWELGCLEEITCHQLYEMSEPYMQSGLKDTHPPSRSVMFLLREMFPEVPQGAFKVSATCKSENGYVKVGDVVLWRSDSWRIGELLMLLAVQGTSLAFLSKWQAVNAGCYDKFARYTKVDEESLMVSADSLECSLTHRPCYNNTLTTVYIPFEYRGQRYA